MPYPVIASETCIADQTIMVSGYPPFQVRRPYAWAFEPDGWIFSHSWHYFCPVCGEIWARAIFFGKDFKHVPVLQPCHKHPTTKWHIAGSLLQRSNLDGLPHDPILLEHMPEALLKRELELHLLHEELYQ